MIIELITLIAGVLILLYLVGVLVAQELRLRRRKREFERKRERRDEADNSLVDNKEESRCGDCRNCKCFLPNLAAPESLKHRENREEEEEAENIRGRKGD